MQTIRVLLIEDNIGDVDLIQAALYETAVDPNAAINFEVNVAQRLGTAIEQLAHTEIDVILLDLSLPDSTGLETFNLLFNHVANVPIVILTGLGDEQIAVQAVRAGAQDYLVKGQTDGPLQVRAVRYALERHQLQVKLAEARRQAIQASQRAAADRSYQHYLALTEGSSALNGGKKRAGAARREVDDALIETLAAEYHQIVIRYIRAVRIREDRPSKQVSQLAHKLKEYGFRARDVVRLHLSVLDPITSITTPAEEQAFSSDARLVLVELLGRLLDLYRPQSAKPN